MKLDREEIGILMNSGMSAYELFHGVEVVDPQLIGLTRKVKAKTPEEKRAVLFQRARLLIERDHKRKPF